MKIWNSYGSEHSLNLVIIGRFKENKEAEEFKDLIERIKDFVMDDTNYIEDSDRYDSKTKAFLNKENLFELSPDQLGSFLYDSTLSIKDNEVHISSDDWVFAFVSLLVRRGAKVETFSAHSHPINTEE